jgi:CheY-like chemotaxis protein
MGYGMKVLVAEDESDLLIQYRTILEDNNHTVVTAEDGEIILEDNNHTVVTAEDGEIGVSLYAQELDKLSPHDIQEEQNPFDVVILDYQMPKKNGLDVAKEILTMCPKQRIIFASAYVQETLVDSINILKQIVELLQKPFTLQALIDTIEDKEIYAELEKLNVNIHNLKVLNPTHAQIRDYLNALKQLQKGRTF